MSEMRCPKHDRIFDTLTDHRKPGALAAGNLPAHPKDGHVDCPLCEEEAKYNPTHTSTSSGGFRTIARG